MLESTCCHEAESNNQIDLQPSQENYSLASSLCHMISDRIRFVEPKDLVKVQQLYHMSWICLQTEGRMNLAMS